MTKRLELIASLVDKDAKVIDIGTDHAYLLIMLYEKGIKGMGTDIHQNALDGAKKNLEEYHLENEIPLVLADGLKNVDVNGYNTLVIAGMGYMSINHILDGSELGNIKCIIIQSNNDYDKVRYLLNKLEYTLEVEKIIIDKKKIYHVMKYTKGKEVLTDEEILLGKYNEEDIWYYKEELLKLKNILKNIPSNHQEEILAINRKISVLEKYCQI